ncbi:MAG: DivIVA domain-containing protein [Solirubrobacteraceae bacterium]
MALDRTSITRRDFPTNRRGYDPAAVDAHLASLADQVDELQRRASASAAPLAAATSEQVRAIVEAAERSVASMRSEAEAEAREHVAHVAQAADELRARLEQAERDVTQVLSTLREGVGRLHDDLLALQAGAAGLGATVSPTAEPMPEPEPIVPEPEPRPQVIPPLRSVPAPAPLEDPAPDLPPAAADATDDTDAARIVALDLALSGTPREDADRILAAQYTLADRAALLDEVYSAAGS